MRVRREVGRLRRGRIYDAVRRAMRTIGARSEFRVVHLSIQSNHLHFLVEATDRLELSRGMQALNISVARAINKALGRRGKVFAYRYHATEVTNPTQARNALAYVLNNWRRHDEDEASERARFAALDPYSSAIAFTGWSDFTLGEWPPGYEPLPVSPPQTWLLQVGWTKAKRPISAWETPRALH
jgi:REP element-mobilizing transposase RayT